jgi:FkbM family methyltransferase
MQITGEPRVGGYIERVEINLIDTLPEGRVTVLDVGANVGDFTQAVLERRPEARVLAFDAQPACKQALVDRFGSRITILGALGAHPTTREFFTDAPASPLGTFHLRPQVPEVRLRSLGHVEVRTIAQVLGEREIEHVDLLKLDCEGHEWEVLAGAVPVLDRVDALYWEMFVGARRYTNHTMSDFTALLGDEFAVEEMSPRTLYLATRKG